jgi:hypothetical protein
MHVDHLDRRHRCPAPPASCPAPLRRDPAVHDPGVALPRRLAAGHPAGRDCGEPSRVSIRKLGITSFRSGFADQGMTSRARAYCGGTTTVPIIMRHIIAIAAAALAFIPGAQAQQTIEADNGAVFHILRTMHYSDGTAQAAISTPDADEIGLISDCRGHMATFNSGLRSIAPRSVAGRIAQIACGARTHS